VRRIRNVVPLLVAVLVAGLAPAAYADPPDPSWIGGYWDDDDYDTVVVVIASACAILGPATVGTGPLWVPIARVEPADQKIAPAPRHSASRPRAPPVSPLPLG
jgi:hypothetical protein